MINAQLPFQNFTSATMSGTQTLTSSATSIMYVNGAAQQLTWTGNASGNFYIQGSMDYNPGAPQSRGEANAGHWINLNSSLSANPVATGSADSILINIDGVHFPWIRVQYTNSTGSGVLNGYISGKSQG